MTKFCLLPKHIYQQRSTITYLPKKIYQKKIYQKRSTKKDVDAAGSGRPGCADNQVGQVIAIQLTQHQRTAKRAVRATSCHGQHRVQADQGGGGIVPESLNGNL